MHGPRRMVFRDVESGEIVEIGLDLRAIGNGEADRGKQGLDACHGTGDRMQRCHGIATTRQGHIEDLGRQLPFQFRGLNTVAPRAQQGFEFVLGLVDARARGLAFLDGQRPQRLHLLRDGSVLAQVTRLDLIEYGQAGSRGKGRFRILENFIEIHARTRCFQK